MPWFEVTDSKPAEGERVLLHEETNGRIEFGRYVGGRWYVEDSRDGRLTEAARVTHWGPFRTPRLTTRRVIERGAGRLPPKEGARRRAKFEGQRSCERKPATVT